MAGGLLWTVGQEELALARRGEFFMFFERRPGNEDAFFHSDICERVAHVVLDKPPPRSRDGETQHNRASHLHTPKTQLTPCTPS